jgi:hypothetical protein
MDWFWICACQVMALIGAKAVTTTLREDHHAPRSSHDAKVYACRVDGLRAMLGAAYTAAWDLKQNRSLDEAIQLMRALMRAPETEAASHNASVTWRRRP